MSKAVSHEQPTIFGDGDQSRDFIFVSDVVDALISAATCPAAAGRAINIGTGRAVTVNRLWQTVRDMAGLDLAALHADERPGDIRDSVADIRQAQSLLGFKPKVPFEKGLQQTFSWYRKAIGVS